MLPSMPVRPASLFTLALLALAGCSPGSGNVPAAAVPQAAMPARCPDIAVRDGTRMLRTDAYAATIVQTTRSCSVIDGRLAVQVRVAGDISFAGTDPAELPIRVAVVDGSSVQYSQLGRQSAAPGASTFTFVDSALRLPEPAGPNVTIYVGFDERN